MDQPGGDQLDRAMERYASGEDTAFAVVYDGLADRLHRYLRRHTSDGVAEDLLQEAFLHIHRSRGSFIRGARVLPWAYAIARSLLIDRQRRQRRETAVMSGRSGTDENTRSSDAGADQVLEAAETARRLADELARLPDSHRDAFGLLKQEGLSLRDAADVLGTSISAVKLRAHRAYVALRMAIGEQDGE